MKTDSRAVVPHDYVFYTGLEDLQRIKTWREVQRVRYALDNHNLRVDGYYECPKVFPNRKLAEEYIKAQGEVRVALTH